MVKLCGTAQLETLERRGTELGRHLKRSLTAASLAPMYLFSTSGPFTLTRRIPAAATAAATMWVFPQPGGPYSSTPVRSLNGALPHAMPQSGGMSADLMSCFAAQLNDSGDTMSSLHPVR